MDKITERILKIINTFCHDATYKIIENDDILSKLPKKYKLNVEDLKNIIHYLQERDYINVKFVDDKNMCVSSLPKGRLHFENILNQNKITNSYRRLFLISITVSGIMSFLGAFLAIILFK